LQVSFNIFHESVDSVQKKSIDIVFLHSKWVKTCYSMVRVLIMFVGGRLMKKFINDVENVENEMLEGIVLAHPEYVARVEGFDVLIRADKKVGKVALVSGGGSGHEPSHGGFVGKGMLDGAVAGSVFTSPTPDQVFEAIKAVDAGEGVLLVIKNYTGDIMNFEMAAELAEAEGIKVANVVTNDDVAVEDSLYTTGRRGVAGTVFVHKIAGAKAEAGASLEEVKATALKVIANVRTMGVALKPCTVPAAGKPGFELSEDEMELGIGIHGEPGTERKPIQTADEIVDYLMDRILKDMDPKAGDEVAVMINGAGATPPMELYILNRRVQQILADKGVKVFKTFVGDYMTSIDMAGASITLLKLDAELKDLLLAQADTIGFKMY
jgi:dihydroxyacetone kinase-like protein